MDDYEKFLFDLQKTLRIDLTGYKRPQMERRINSLMRTLGFPDYGSFVRTMTVDKQILDRFLNHLTINVSEFFRNSSQWQVLEDQILPALLKRNPRLKIWSAGCSTGEECYTLTMILMEIAPGNHTILATDFDDRVLEKAQAGFYNKKAAAGIPEAYLKKYFHPQDDGFQVKDELKKYITFRHHNLLKDPFPDQLDLIVCRNVVIYFTEETKMELYKKFYQSLRHQGILFTGSTEQIIQYREIGFESAAVFFYRRP